MLREGEQGLKEAGLRGPSSREARLRLMELVVPSKSPVNVS